MRLTKQLITNRLRLVPLDFDHLEAMMTWVNDQSVIANSSYWRQGENTAKKVAGFILDQEKDQQVAYFAVVARGDCQASEEANLGYIGNVHLLNINVTHRHCQLGITIKSAAWNRGFAQEAIPALIDFAFEELNMNKVYVQLFTDNELGIHLWRDKLGFEINAKFTDHYFVNGAFHDMVQLTLMRTAWASR